ncbi:MAG: hypothetical protein JSV52_02650 [Candidatus Zixiibacteriota bacterium]|nr:MAG: hypothetical protein JSV52_02650 [candidate division Zixibacteria bacterium]
MKPKFVLIGVVMAVLSVGCGVYTFTPRGKSDIKSISVERFDNETAEYGLEDRMTDQIIDALLAEGTLKVLSTEYSDAVLYGTLTRYDRNPFDYDENDQVQTYAITMTFDITLKKAADDTEIWKESIIQKGVYDIASETEEDGQQRAIDLLIEDIINKTTKSW